MLRACVSLVPGEAGRWVVAEAFRETPLELELQPQPAPVSALGASLRLRRLIVERVERGSGASKVLTVWGPGIDLAAFQKSRFQVEKRNADGP